jgi:TatD DNase family protein
MLIDTHSHLNFKAFKDDAESVIRESLAKKVWMINVGSQWTTSQRAVEIAQKYQKGVYAAVGLHPLQLEDRIIKEKIGGETIKFRARKEEFDYSEYKKLADNPKVVAIGEVGLDYYSSYTEEEKESLYQRQKETLLKQIQLAKELNLPVIFHCRKAHNDLIEILKAKSPSSPPTGQAGKFQVLSSKIRGVIHCFTGKWRQAEEYLDMGFYIGFNGIIFKLNLEEIIKKTPLDRILVETDCPYLTPPGFAEKRNNPLAVKLVVKKIAEIKNLDYGETVRTTTKNARKLFKI